MCKTGMGVARYSTWCKIKRSTVVWQYGEFFFAGDTVNSYNCIYTCIYTAEGKESFPAQGKEASPSQFS